MGDRNNEQLLSIVTLVNQAGTLPSVGASGDIRGLLNPFTDLACCILKFAVIGSIYNKQMNFTFQLRCCQIYACSFFLVVVSLFSFPQRKGPNTSLAIMYYRVKILESLNTTVKLWLLGR